LFFTQARWTPRRSERWSAGTPSPCSSLPPRF
jgi:hypothetical protein